MSFADALADLNEACDRDYAVPAELNGNKVMVIVANIEVLQTFGPGGRSQMPTTEISLSREEWERYKISDPDASISKNRFKVGGEEFRALPINSDLLASWVRIQCGPLG